eukprot:3209010-Amphidinium_carterae.1
MTANELGARNVPEIFRLEKCGNVTAQLQKLASTQHRCCSHVDAGSARWSQPGCYLCSKEPKDWVVAPGRGKWLTNPPFSQQPLMPFAIPFQVGLQSVAGVAGGDFGRPAPSFFDGVDVHLISMLSMKALRLD